jgi:hypothetical protein
LSPQLKIISITTHHDRYSTWTYSRPLRARQQIQPWPTSGRAQQAPQRWTLDRDGPTIRRFRDLLIRIVNDLGGEAELSEGQIQLARRCAWISAQCELLEQRAEPGTPFDLTIYSMLTSHLTRTLSVLGLKRQPRDVTPTLADYLKAIRQPQPEPQPEDEE